MTEEKTAASACHTNEHRVTVRFRSDCGNEYLYDDVTGSIFPWNPLLEAVLSLELIGGGDKWVTVLVSQYGEREFKAALALVRKWRKRYRAFTRTANEPDVTICLSEVEVQRHIRFNSFVLLLILTENCNLRCRYCALSDVYPLNRVRTTRMMTVDTAKRAIDWYAELVKPQRARNPRKRFGLSLYGGEPLLGSNVLRSVLEYSQQTYPDMFIPVMTTNGTLLNPRNIELLVRYNVLVAISIDGPQAEHDRLRVDSRGRGSFAAIARNLQTIRRDHPQYWKSRLASVSVFDCGTDLEATEAFFHDNAEVMPRSIFVNQVGAHNTSWYSQYSVHDRERTDLALARLREQYKKAKISGAPISHYLECLVGVPITMVALRRRLRDDRLAELPYSGACLPGTKVAVHVDGKIDMCERVNGTYPIGHLDSGGINYGTVANLLDTYRKEVLSNCSKCPVTRQCGLCYSHVENRGTFSKSADRCASVRRETIRRMADYVSILEENPGADLKFETDTARLETRTLLFC